MDGASLKVAVQHRAGRHFIPVVIFGFDPEHGGGCDVMIMLDALGKPKRGKRLVKGKCGPTEKACLLARDDGNRSRVGQSLSGLERRGGGLSLQELVSNHRHYL
jgi:hypothetical protein